VGNDQHGVLSGWKDIASYLGRGVRTVQRYERDCGLPIRRLSGSRQGSVVATRDDLDMWVKLRPISRMTQGTQIDLSSALKKSLQEQARLCAQMRTLRKELAETTQKIRLSISKVRQGLDETRKRQDATAAVIAQYANAYRMRRATSSHERLN